MSRAEPGLTDRSEASPSLDVQRVAPSTSRRPRRDGQVTPRRLLGAFYTPDDLATILTRWAIAGSPGTVLDPSYGGCAFLRAAVTLLRELRAKDPSRLAFGVDIDPDCVYHAEGLVAADNHITADFLSLRRDDVPGAPFKAIVGNPPYVRHHWLKGAKRRAANSVAARADADLHATASTWAYFVLHALDFLARDGRLAFLVPEAILQADYARAVRDVLRKRFARVMLVHLRDRIFSDTDEPVVVIAAEGVGPGTIRIESIECADALEGALNGAGSLSPRREIISNGREVDRKIVQLVTELAVGPDIATLGSIATIRIGFVTGSNHFFIRSEKDIARLGIPGRALERVVGRTKWLMGLAFTKDDHRHLTQLGRRTLLVRPTRTNQRHRSVQAWISEGEGEGIDRRHKCLVRDPWFQVDTGPRPDAFITCSRMSPPLLVLNHSGYRCSNALHYVRWRHLPSVSPETVSVGFLCSLTAVWAEIHGRRYGGGVLKLEPGALRNIPVPLIPAASAAFQEIDSYLRGGREERARAAADNAMLREGMGLSNKDIASLQRARRDLARQRMPTRNGAKCG